LKDRLKLIQERIDRAAERCRRPGDSIKLIAVSKTKPVEAVKEAIAAGVTDLGENYIQEAREKVNALAMSQVNWHFIGHLQSNKAKYAVRLFDLIHSVDSLKLAGELNKYAQNISKVQSVLVQVNVAKEGSKSGVYVEETVELLKQLSRLENISVKGLMTMPPYFNAPDKVRPYFAALRELRDQIRAEDIANIGMEELSMGMTGDFETAIEEGATMVRIGTAIFGERH
jgi:pyridoxal phosphate enzyme (YggS family)